MPRTSQYTDFEQRVIDAANASYNDVDGDVWNGRAPEDDEFYDIIFGYIDNHLSREDCDALCALPDARRRELILAGM